MKAITVLYAGALAEEAFSPAFGRASAFERALDRAARFPGVGKVAVLGREGAVYPGLPPGAALTARPEWTKKTLLEEIARLGEGWDLTYFAWADEPFLDTALAGALADRAIRYAAEYAYADGWPRGFAPEVLSPGTAGILSKLLQDGGGKVGRDTVFDVLQKDINAFDIETEISPVDLRQRRLSLTADCKRNLLLCTRLWEAGLDEAGAAGAAALIEKRPELLRTLPAFFPVQVLSDCPQDCSICPWPKRRPKAAGGGGAGEALSLERFEELLDRIIAFAGDAVIDLSLWGELALHPERDALIRACLDRRELSLIVETAGVGWNGEELEALASDAGKAAPRIGEAGLPPLSWIVSLDAQDGERYAKIRGPGRAEAVETAGRLLRLFPEDAYIQAVRLQGAEDDIEAFYRHWQEKAPSRKNIIIQKYDDFCGAQPRLQASDLSPVTRLPCWHIQRDFNVLLNGDVPVCREDLSVLAGGGGEEEREGGLGLLGNVWEKSLEEIWERGSSLYLSQAGGDYQRICGNCDEYYTFNY